MKPASNAFPATREALFERIADDHPWALEEFCNVIDTEGAASVPFVFNSAQRKYVREIWQPGVRRVVVGKSRKWGFSTLALGLGLLRTITTPGWTFRIVAHKQATANQLNKTVKLLYESLWSGLKACGEDPAYYLPKPTSDHVLGYEFGAIRSSVVVDTASGKGVGQSDRNDDLYLTEYSDWDNAEDAFAGLRGSQPAGSKTSRIVIDFNAHGTGNDAYVKYTRAKLPHDDPKWNGFTPFFAGILDCPEWYSQSDMDIARRDLGKLFPAVYPSNDEEMFLANDKAVWLGSYLRDARELGNAMGYQPNAKNVIHAVDTASGNPGGDYQVCSSWGRTVEGIWIEVCPPIRGHWPEDVFAEKVAERCDQYPGVCIVERNVGAAVILRLRQLDVPNLYRHRHRDKTGAQYMQLGFQTTAGSKKIMIAEVGRMLRDGEIAMVDTPHEDGQRYSYLFTEALEYEWKVRETMGQEELSEVAGAPDRQDAHDDYVMTMMLMTQAIGQYVVGDLVQMVE